MKRAVHLNLVITATLTRCLLQFIFSAPSVWHRKLAFCTGIAQLKIKVMVHSAGEAT